jgi:hypothetical protein
MTRVWIIDDELSRFEAEDLLGEGHEVLEVTAPDDESFDDALSDEWDLILVDEELWPDASRKPPHAVDGSSLVAAIRAWARIGERQLPGLVILTNMAGVFANEVPAVGAWRPVSETFVQHEAEIGRTLDVEWLLTKQDPALRAKVADLANALVRAREAFGDGGISFSELKGYLGVPAECSWSKLADAALRQSRPPVTEDLPGAAAPQRGVVTVFIWLLQRVLAFPGLFVSDLQAAAFLGLKPEALSQASDGDASLAACIYHGPLSSLVARRWWVPGLDDFMARAETEDRKLTDIPGLTAADALDIQDPVVVLDRTLKEHGIVPLADAVRVNPQGWPAEALQPWMGREESGQAPPWVQEMVEPMDRAESPV